MSSWLRRRKRVLRSELKVPPQIDQLTGSDLIPARWERKGGGGGEEEGGDWVGEEGGRDETGVRDSEGGDGQRGH